MEAILFLLGLFLGGLSQVWFIRSMKSKGLLIFNATPKLLKELNVNPKIKCGIRAETPYVKISRHYMPKEYCDAIKPQYMDEL